MEEEKKFYLTKQGLEKIKKEYELLKNLKSAKASGKTPEILHSEDANPEYLVFQEDMNFLETRLLELENVLKNAEIIKPPTKEKQDVIELGATVLVDMHGQKDEFVLVGSLEANPSLGKISNESPVGRALIGLRVGDVAAVSSSNAVNYKIKKIQYKPITS